MTKSGILCALPIYCKHPRLYWTCLSEILVEYLKQTAHDSYKPSYDKEEELYNSHKYNIGLRNNAQSFFFFFFFFFNTVVSDEL